MSLAKQMTTSQLGYVSSGRWVSRITLVMGPNDLFSMGGSFIPYWPLGWAHFADRVSRDFLFRFRSTTPQYIYIYIYRERERERERERVQITPDVTLSDVTLLNIF